MIKDAIAKVVDRLDLTEAEAEAAMQEIMEGQATPAQIAAYVTALRMKGETVNEIGIGFLFAPSFHGAMKHAVGPRQEIGVRTIFNLLGPLTNPAWASVQIVGVYHEALTDLMASVLMRLGVRHCYVVHGMDGLDEITLTDRTRVSEGKAGRLTSYMVEPRDFGLQRVRVKDLEGRDAEENWRITRDGLSGREGPRQQLVLVNAAPVLIACGKAATLQDGAALARTIIQSGAAMDKLERLIKWTNR